MCDTLKFRLPFSCIVCGTNGSDKSSICIRFVQKFDALCTKWKFGVGIVLCYSEKSTVPLRKQLPANFSFNEGVHEEICNSHDEPYLVILDDLLNNVYFKQVCDLFTRSRHHRTISVIMITRNLFHQGRFCRDISLNTHYILALKNVREKKHFMYLANEVYPEDSISLYNAYLDATQEPHDYFLLDLTRDMNDGLKFRTNIFPTDISTIAVYSDKGDEACEVKLSYSPSPKDSRS